jgi:hypothetical protein
VGIAFGVVLLAAIAVATVLLVRDSGRGEDAGTETMTEAALSAEEPVVVTIDTEPDALRLHPVAMTGGQEATVFVTADEPFAPGLAVLDPAGVPVPMETTALGERGASVSFAADESGEHTLYVDGFSAGPAGYTAEMRVGSSFTTPGDVPVGECVDRWDDQEWQSVDGFLVVPCDQPHEGQVFEQISDLDQALEAAQDQCRQARIDRIELPGYVNWITYSGDDLTCILVGQDGSLLDRSAVEG